MVVPDIRKMLSYLGTSRSVEFDAAITIGTPAARKVDSVGTVALLQ
jgi:hypothetical protein